MENLGINEIIKVSFAEVPLKANIMNCFIPLYLHNTKTMVELLAVQGFFTGDFDDQTKLLTTFFGETAHPHNWTEQAKITKALTTFLLLVYSLAESVARNSLQTLMTVPPFSYLLDENFMEEQYSEKNTTATDPESDVDFSETCLFDEDTEPPVAQSGSKSFTVYEADSTTQVAPITARTSKITKLSDSLSPSGSATSTILTPSGKLVMKNSEMEIDIEDSSEKLDTQAVPPNRQKLAVPSKRLEKIITGHPIPEDRKTKIRDIMIYDVPIEWSYEKILNELTAWGTTISATVKKQKKYQTIRVKIALSSFTVSSFDKGLWSYTLGKKVVRWYPGAWTLAD
jgi:hypothetical protein